MKILFVIENFNTGGRERRLAELLNGLNKWYPDIEISLLIFGEINAYKDLKELRVKIYNIDFKSNVSLLFRYIEILKKIKPEIVQTWTIKTSTYFSILKSFFKYKLITSYVADSFGYRTRSLKIQAVFINLFTDKVIGNSKAGLDSYKIPINKRVVVYNGYDLSRLNQKKSHIDIIRDLDIITPYVILMVASVSKNKDYDTFIKVARTVIKKRKDISFLSIGDGEYLQKYRSMLTIDDKNNIKFLGHRNDVDSIVEVCDIGLLCTFSEGISNAILEYMMHKKPVIATGTGGTSEIVQNGRTGYILPDSSPKLVANKILELIDNPILSKEMGIRGYQLALNKFSLLKNTTEYYQLYRELTKK